MAAILQVQPADLIRVEYLNWGKPATTHVIREEYEARKTYLNTYASTGAIKRSRGHSVPILPGSIVRVMPSLKPREPVLFPDFRPAFSPWRHGGWYVHNVRYPSGACGCVSRNYADRKWRIACDPRPFDQQPTFPNRDAAARGELALVRSMAEASQ